MYGFKSEEAIVTLSRYAIPASLFNKSPDSVMSTFQGPSLHMACLVCQIKGNLLSNSWLERKTLPDCDAKGGKVGKETRRAQV